MRACLIADVNDCLAWRTTPVAELNRVTDPGGGLKWTLPLLDHRLQAVVTDDSVRIRLRAAALHEQRRSATFDAIAAATIARLNGVDVVPMLSRGQALALNGGYSTSALRHRHDLDILVPTGSMPTAIKALVEDGYAPLSAAEGARLRHPTGLFVVLHEQPLPFPEDHLDKETLWREAIRFKLGAANYLTPSPTHLLLHTLLLAGGSPPGAPLVWACDAFRAASHPDVDWMRISGTRDAAAATVLRGLSYLAARLSAPVPRYVIDRLRQTTEALPRRDLDTALFRLQRACELRAMVGGRGRTLAWLAPWILAPDPDAMLADGRKQTVLISYLGRLATYRRARTS